MYLFLGIIFGLCILFFIINFYRRTCIIKKICCMDYCKKLNLLNTLAKPFGFYYLPNQDIITSRLNPWQKKLGYRSAYDKSAPRFNMILDCEPIYFNYKGHTWLIEFWKGQYGISLGGEVGIYKADTLLLPDQYEQAQFYGVSNSDLLSVSMTLSNKGTPLFTVCQRHWWLTGFRIGSYCEPENLTMDVSITFPSEEMLHCFTKSLEQSGYKAWNLSIHCLKVSFSFSIPHMKQPRHLSRFHACISQWENQFFCKLYAYITKPFTCTLDRILYLYFFLPVAIRRIFRFPKKPKYKFLRKDQKHR